MGRLGVSVLASVLSVTLSRAALSDPTARTPAEAGTAQNTEPASKANARYREGVEAYRAKRYGDAIVAFIDADILVPSAALSYDVARAYEKLRDSRNAVMWYRDYLYRSGFIGDRAQVEQRIAALENSIEPKTRAVSTSPEPPGALLTQNDVRAPNLRTARMPEPERPVRALPTSDRGPASTGRGNTLRTAGFITAGTGVAAIAAGLFFEIERRRTESETAHEDRQVRFAESYDTMERQQTAARILVGTGAVLFVGGGALLLFSRSHQSAPRITAVCLPSECSASVRGGF
jgi:hypothetical protein